ncbi:MAG: UDP-4-amino-4,6-dideoxy-N-acetyl-beta-L-altrosamine transaminase [Candidatus Omnitrophica bacterium]|nr:UDP-4-amino-4,6-dideoxy-N-acetyl-beta-L-altrosamine transaminase [Candidatus Omnitrophota bacterium]
MKNIPYARQWIKPEDIYSVKRALGAQYITQGPLVAVFERLVAAYCNAKYAVAVNSGTSALHIACLAAGLKEGDEGISSPITFAASTNCLLYCKAKPVFADILDGTACINPEDIKKKLNRRTRVIIPVHFAGHPCDMQEIACIAQKNNLFVIEDAAHALGAEYKGSKIGSSKYSDMTILSFHAVKHITTAEGGIALTNNKRLYERLKLFRNHGITKDPHFLGKDHGPWYYEMRELGFNYRLTDIQSALGISQLKKLDFFLKIRKGIVNEYNKAFSQCEEIKPLEERNYVRSAHHLYVLRFDFKKIKASKIDLFNEYRKKGIIVNLHYIPVYYHPYYKKLGFKKGVCPNAEKFYEEALTLPLFPKMKEREVIRVIGATKNIIKKFNRSKI